MMTGTRKASPRPVTFAVFCALTAAFIAAPAANAAAVAPMALNFSADFLWNPDPGNETQVFLHVSNTTYNPPRREVERVFHRIDNPERDYPIMLFMAHEGHTSLSVVFNLRSKGLRWIQIMRRLRIPHDRVFMRTKRDPGPPYGKAYGHWKKQPRGEVVMNDDDIRYWVNIRTMSRFFNTDPDTVMEWRDSGKSWKKIAKGRFKDKRKNQAKRKKMMKAGAYDQGDNNHQGNSKGKGRGRGHKD